MPAHERLQEAARLREAGNLKDARKLLLELVTEHPESAQARLQCALVHDLLGRERDAIPHYERALELGLGGAELEEALIGLGSAYRVAGQLEKSQAVLDRALQAFSSSWPVRVFRAMTLEERGESLEASRILLTCIAETSSDAGIQAYRNAIRFRAQSMGGRELRR